MFSTFGSLETFIRGIQVYVSPGSGSTDPGGMERYSLPRSASAYYIIFRSTVFININTWRSRGRLRQTPGGRGKKGKWLIRRNRRSWWQVTNVIRF